MKILHLSDLHFPTRIPIFQLRGKRIVGYLNYTLRRRKKYPLKIWQAILSFVEEFNLDSIVISGDITNVSHETEFKEAWKLLNELPRKKVFYIPGNHDRYTRDAVGKHAYYEKYFSELSGDSILSANEEYIRIRKIEDLHLVGWDSSLPLPILGAYGNVSPEIVEKTLSILEEKKIRDYILVCHHPIWNPSHRQETSHHKLINREEVASLLKQRPPLAFLHGHVHTNWVKLPGEELPYHVVNSASSTRTSDAKHDCGFHVLEVTGLNLKIKRYMYQSEQSKFTEAPLVSYSEKE
ncbi:phosphohydrolase [Leptospira gomenensis]|uniref:Phosphohydrolase n=1 Tax=Leptospira gomenensis TaxID=2484974 RepID=A0A5F1YSA8_9LEPT|nr:metallophosphoesterase [Leptospira gomenensis]TGK27897.1 phosphohydrolase [Leptospira gomenensis]TGK36344.1 phosphohydrolase [Leptospira gomenensis]TGK42825.1 phosphohydrolase [Leptospira gomenensis]TGK60800.1 phosphohydrolase [Leptospira gomenensis]